MPARPGAQNAKTILGVVVGYSLDEARQHFLGRRFRLRTHAHYPVPPSAIKCSFGMLGGKRLFPKLSDPPRVKSHLVWQEKRRRSAALEFRRGRASDIDSYTACPTQFLRHALSVVHKSPRSQPRSQPRHNSSRSMAGGVVFFQDQATLRARRRSIFATDYLFQQKIAIEKPHRKPLKIQRNYAPFRWLFGPENAISVKF